MIEIIDKTKIVQVRRITCDRCGKQHSDNPRSCWACGKDLCPDCLVSHYTPDTFREYPPNFCKPCWAIGEPFLKQWNDEIARHDNAIEAIEAAWRKAAMEAVV